jgi:hypothetical protein
VPGIRRSALERFSVIVQSETSQLTQEQVRSALREALDQAEQPAG